MIPDAWNYSRFLSNLMKEQGLINEMFDTALKEIMKLLTDFGETLAIDGKAIESYARKENENNEEDGRRDMDANTGIKKYSGRKGKQQDW